MTHQILVDPIVVDTDVVSYLLKPNDSRAPLYWPELRNRLPIISFQTLAELLYWAAVRQWGTGRRARLDRHLQRFFVQPWDPTLCEYWAAARLQGRQRGTPLDSADAWQAATALYLGVPLLTHNRRHFDWVSGLQLVSHAP